MSDRDGNTMLTRPIVPTWFAEGMPPGAVGFASCANVLQDETGKGAQVTVRGTPAYVVDGGLDVLSLLNGTETGMQVAYGAKTFSAWAGVWVKASAGTAATRRKLVTWHTPTSAVHLELDQVAGAVSLVLADGTVLREVWGDLSEWTLVCGGISLDAQANVRGFVYVRGQHYAERLVSTGAPTDAVEAVSLGSAADGATDVPNVRVRGFFWAKGWPGYDALIDIGTYAPSARQGVVATAWEARRNEQTFVCPVTSEVLPISQSVKVNGKYYSVEGASELRT